MKKSTTERHVTYMDNCYSKEELQEILAKMRKTNSEFYQSAIRTGCHPFIEFCGVMKTYIDICQRAYENNFNFTQANTHSGVALPIMGYEMAYLAEKLDCIFGPSLRADPKVKEEFLKAFNK